jgi:hypothetical protein
MPKECLKIDFKNYFYKFYSLNLKGLFSNHFVMQISPFGQFIKQLLKICLNHENMFITVLKCCFEY